MCRRSRPLGRIEKPFAVLHHMSVTPREVCAATAVLWPHEDNRPRFCRFRLSCRRL